MGVHEVTQQQFRTIMRYNPSHFSKDGKAAEGGKYLDDSKPAGGKDEVKDMNTDDFPVENVSYDEAVKFTEKLNEKEKETLAGWKYSLPTEAQWEYACRGGAKTYQKYHFGDAISEKFANYNGNLGRTAKVGSYAANAFGLHDMHGNVWEWCLDWYEKDSSRVYRGGSWYSDAGYCRAAYRYGFTPSYRVNYLGFRVARVRAR
jgi:formylglycine-generating enzyme required for sulfatase activity